MTDDTQSDPSVSLYYVIVSKVLRFDPSTLKRPPEIQNEKRVGSVSKLLRFGSPFLPF